MKKISIIHLIPEDRIGGVEIAAKSFLMYESDLLSFSVNYIFIDNEKTSKKYSLSQLIKIIVKAKHISQNSPDVVILSLWRSCLCGLFIKLFKPKIKLITFLHSCNDVHFFDFFITRITTLFSIKIFADSQATISQRIAWLPSKKIELISFLIKKNEIQQLSKNVTPSFIFWGRLSREKGLDNSIRFFYEIYKKYPHATFMIIGPDCGILDQLKEQIKFLKIESAVSFSGVLSTYEIAKCASDASFYLQSSLFEGMGMSVVEAMQLGLVPIVKPVGQIAFYCKDGYNAVFINCSDSIKKIILLLENNELYQYFRYNTISSWRNQVSYSESMAIACTKISKLLKSD